MSRMFKPSGYDLLTDRAMEFEDVLSMPLVIQERILEPVISLKASIANLLVQNTALMTTLTPTPDLTATASSSSSFSPSLSAKETFSNRSPVTPKVLFSLVSEEGCPVASRSPTLSAKQAFQDGRPISPDQLFAIVTEQDHHYVGYSERRGSMQSAKEDFDCG
ncbi:hypothetical protein BU23DRAFT_241950 [Bimuria novae-zelandiae CBS 107.79]|uniref:Uncharacterized protein n=1 Tax=Bimuria novae-zelandiae CBS 107.79 TaxID=1447943 RepID=A0A6A5V7K8_9PLEO|nr:hypothetical protein BU23DRAFT_241950 [Bimuria novae-zelandiae CBS 107.79]